MFFFSQANPADSQQPVRQATEAANFAPPPAARWLIYSTSCFL
jgi:hypothetical protein